MTKINQKNIKTFFQMYFSYHNFYYGVQKSTQYYQLLNKKTNNNNKRKRKIIYLQYTFKLRFKL